MSSSYTISDSWDLSIDVSEHGSHLDHQGNSVKQISRTARFRVEREKLCSCDAADKYEVAYKTGVLNDWFIRWYRAASKGQDIRRDCRFQRQVLFPLYAFDYALGFLQATRYLAYFSDGYITELNPAGLTALHLPARVIQQLNTARAGLRNALHYGLFSEISRLLRSGDCSCKENTFFQYFKALQKIDVWPLERNMKNICMTEMIDRCLGGFDDSKIRPDENCKPGPRTGGSKPFWKRDTCLCDRDWKVVVRSAARETNAKFEGLCLDCMSITKCLQEGRDPDHEYWTHTQHKEWDINCRVNHGQSSHWYSFMGRREKRGVAGYTMSGDDSTA
ncbi:hypothetical protein BJY04DRAFT_220453 [Aspergillus karnatakaensis]|uniref:uncharacterized protein n=1 Tax=Aspergillus karnatakaensis TaxID=1810916 RepID=UPI003CCCC9DD